jgi:glycosyltransferase involved in cell wall biosynthesis
MSATPLISICIPAYQSAAYLDRLLDSIKNQNFKDFEVIISDDSPDDAVARLAEHYSAHLPLTYHKNKIALGSPSNWNKSISLASGHWIKVMHDDDWFADEHALAAFANHAKGATSDFIFSGFHNVILNTGEASTFRMNGFQRFVLRWSPLLLFRRNYIGHPSTTLIRNNLENWFDPKIKWVVDFEFYIRVLYNQRKFVCITKPLVNIGLGAHQITQNVFRKREVEIPENLYLLNLIGFVKLKNIFVFDYYWRLIRNLNIADISTMRSFSSTIPIPLVIEKMILLQKKIGNQKLTTNRYLSKCLMLILYLQLLLLFTDFKKSSK